MAASTVVRQIFADIRHKSSLISNALFATGK